MLVRFVGIIKKFMNNNKYSNFQRIFKKISFFLLENIKKLFWFLIFKFHVNLSNQTLLISSQMEWNLRIVSSGLWSFRPYVLFLQFVNALKQFHPLIRYWSTFIISHSMCWWYTKKFINPLSHSLTAREYNVST